MHTFNTRTHSNKRLCVDVINVAGNVAKNQQLQTQIHLSASCQRPALKMTLITNTSGVSVKDLSEVVEADIAAKGADV